MKKFIERFNLAWGAAVMGTGVLSILSSQAGDRSRPPPWSFSESTLWFWRTRWSVGFSCGLRRRKR